MSLTAVVFDCDGVLVDSEPLAFQFWREVAAEGGYEVSPDDEAAVIGISDEAAYHYVAARAKVASLAEVIPRRDAFMLAAIAEGLEPFGDTVDAVKELAAVGVPLAVASSSVRVELDAKLVKLDLARYFEATVAGDEVEAAKPAPDVYLQAAALLGVEPHACLVVEDSAAGAAAATAAGMRVVTVARSGVGPAGYSSVSEVDAASILAWLS